MSKIPAPRKNKSRLFRHLLCTFLFQKNRRAEYENNRVNLSAPRMQIFATVLATLVITCTYPV